jgi:hypothetical protein
LKNDKVKGIASKIYIIKLCIWLKLVILTTWEVVIHRIMFKASRGRGQPMSPQSQPVDRHHTRSPSNSGRLEIGRLWFRPSRAKSKTPFQK